MNAIKTNRKIAILTGAILLTPALLSISATPARADKSKNLRTGAVILGAAAAYLAVKGKTLPAAVAAAGGYYAYKKGQDASNDDRYDDYYGNYDNRNDNGNDDFYNRSNKRDERRQQRRADRRDNSSSRNGDYGYDTGYYGNSGSDNSYDSGYDSSYDNSYNRNDNGYRGYKNYGQWKKAQRTIR